MKHVDRSRAFSLVRHVFSDVRLVAVRFKKAIAVIVAIGIIAGFTLTVLTFERFRYPLPAEPQPRVQPAERAENSGTAARPRAQPVVKQTTPSSTGTLVKPVDETIPGTIPEAVPEAIQESAEVTVRGIILPPAGDVITTFGWQKYEVYGDWRFHPGVDIASKTGADVWAVSAGVVNSVSRDARKLWWVEIGVGASATAVYGGLQSAVVSPGQHVIAGQKIGTAGKSCTSETPAVHFGLVSAGKPVNPFPNSETVR